MDNNSKLNYGSYDIIKHGGYLSNEMSKNHFIHDSHKNAGKTYLQNKNVITSINYMQSIPLKVNNDVLDYLITCINDNFKFNNYIILETHPKSKDVFKEQMEGNESVVLEILK